ncbi:Tyrosine kinase catalytic domain protein [Ceratobasidium sp. AG-Ba]|nr:Tyrosine kinase catalytic domain protein [Ceratobasidium sp. AG-Ba]
MSYPSPRTPGVGSPTSPTIHSPSTAGRRRVHFNDDPSNPSIRFIPPTPLSPAEIAPDYSDQPSLFDTSTAMSSAARPSWAARRPSMPAAADESEIYYTPVDEHEYEFSSRPLVIPPPPYEHVWRDIFMANSAAERLREALSTTRVEDVYAITKSYPPAISARFALHEHASASGSSTVFPFPSAPGTTISMAASTVPTTPALTAATISTPSSVYTSLPNLNGTSDPDFPHIALSSAHENLRDVFLLYSEQFPARAEYFGAGPKELPGFGGFDTRAQPGFVGGFAAPGGYQTPTTPGGGGYGYEESNPYGYAKAGDFTRPGMTHRESSESAEDLVGQRAKFCADRSVEVVGRDGVIVMPGAEVEEEAMLNEDSLLCLVEDVDTACEALGDNADLCKMVRLQVKELLKFLISHDELVWPPPPGSVHSLGEGVIRSILVQLSRIPYGENPARVSEHVHQMSVQLVEFARSQQFEIYNGVSPSPVDPIPPRNLGESIHQREPVMPEPGPYANPNGRGRADRGGAYTGSESASERAYTNPNTPARSNSTLSGTGPVSSSGGSTLHIPQAGPYKNPNRMTAEPTNSTSSANHSPVPGYSTPGTMDGSTPNLAAASMGLARKQDPTEVLNDPHGLEDLAHRSFEEIDEFMQGLRQDIATNHPDSQRFKDALVYLYEMTGHYPAERDITNEISRISRTAISQDAFSFSHHAMWLGSKAVIVRYLRASASPTKIRRRLKKDIDVWRTLFHPHIHSFISVVLPRHGAFGLVMPLVQHGSVIQHLMANPTADRSRFVLEAAEGLRYLHDDAKLVHGDFRGVNLLVADDGHLLVTGYGVMTAIERNQELGFPQWGLQWGDARWMAPELHHHLNHVTKFPGIRTTQSDVYAFACTALEIWSGLAPFAGHSDASVILEVATKGRHPPRPSVLLPSKSRSDQVWYLLEACWNVNPASRPPIRGIVDGLRNLLA